MLTAIALYEGLTVLDAIGPYAVLSHVPDADVVFCAEKRGRLSDDNGLLHIEVETDFGEIGRPDVVLVPGGGASRLLDTPGTPIVEWIREAHQHSTWTTSVCTGALLLGAAGVLDGLDATTHWMFYDNLAAFGANPTAERVVHRGKVITAAGVSAGIDMALYLVGQIAGDETAQAIQLGIEYDPQPPYDSGSPAKASPEIRELVRSLNG